MRPVLLAALLMLVATREAKPYIDPGTGSYLLQLLLAGVFGASFAVKMFWRNIKSYVRGRAARQSK